MIPRCPRRLLPLLGRASRSGLLRFRGALLPRLCPPAEMTEVWVEFPFHGLRYRGRLDLGIDWWVFFFGDFEPQILRLLADLDTGLSARGKAGIYLDVGTNVGQHLLFMAARGAEVYGVEPFPPVLASARAKQEANGLDPARVFPVGFGAETGRLDYYPPATANTGTGSFVAAAPDNAPTPIALPVRRGDEVLREAGCGPIRLLKIDIEGFEPQALSGLADTLARDRPAVLLEYSEASAGQCAALGRELRDLLYPNVRVLQVDEDAGGYRLTPVQTPVGAPGRMLLALPAELDDLLDGGSGRIGATESVEAGRTPGGAGMVAER